VLILSTTNIYKIVQSIFKAQITTAKHLTDIDKIRTAAAYQAICGKGEVMMGKN